MRRSFSLTLAGSLLILIFNVATGIITARALGPHGKGILRTLIIWPTLLSQIALLGMNEAYIYLKNKRTDILELKSSIFYGVLALSFFFSFILLLLFFTLFRHIVSTSIPLTILIIGYIPVANSIQVGLSFIQEEMKFLKYNLLRVALPITYFILLLFNRRHLSPERCFVLLFMSNLILFVFMLPDFSGLKPSRVSSKSIRDSLNFGIKTQLATIIGSFSQQTDQAILSLMSNPATLGIYSVAVSVSRIGALAPNAAQIVLYPKMAREKEYPLKESILFLFLFNTILYFFLAMTLRKLIILFYGYPFSGATTIALILFASSFPLTIMHVGSAYFKARGKPFRTTVAQIIVFILLLVLIPILYQVSKLKGVSFAVIIAYTCGALYYLFHIRKEHKNAG